MTTVEIVGECSDDVKWFRVYGNDRGTNVDFEGEYYGLTESDKILDCDGCPITAGDVLDVAVRNALDSNKD